jgi:hypothetical protein
LFSPPGLYRETSKLIVLTKVFHAIFSVPLRPILRRLLPAAIFATAELSIWGWEFHDKAAIHEKLGPAFIFVTTGLNRLVCADPSMAHAIMTRRKDFVHPEITSKAMGFLGANIVTVSQRLYLFLSSSRSIRELCGGFYSPVSFFNDQLFTLGQR